MALYGYSFAEPEVVIDDIMRVSGEAGVDGKRVSYAYSKIQSGSFLFLPPI
jgi:hypothetical protein